jgi:glucose/arabinose dehydrogenase/PKD repeat protein
MSRRLLLTLIASGVLAGVIAAPAGAITGLPAGFETSVELPGLTRPTHIAWAPDGRRFVAEKDGVLKVAPPGSNSLQTVLDIRSEVNSFQDRGLLGLAVDSNFASNGYVYLLYSYDLNRTTRTPGPDADEPAVAQLRRLKLGATNQVLESRVILGTGVSGICPAANNDVDCMPSDGTSHSIGSVISAPDGTLFVSTGDAASYAVADPLAFRSYDERSLAGKILRIDRDGRGVANHAFCPSETTLTRVCTKVYAKGFRNPYRIQLLPSGALMVGDVGWETWEEIDVVASPGKSFGWPCYEGPIRTPTYREWNECQPEYAKEGTAGAHAGPVHWWAHDYTLRPSWAVVMGPQYTGDRYPTEYRDSIFFGDYGGGFVKRLKLGSNGQVQSVADVGTGWHTGVDLVAAPNGDIAWVDIGDFNDGAGYVERLEYTPANASPVAVAAATPTSGALPLTVKFDGSGSSDADGDTLSYDWDFGDGTAHGTGAKPSHTYSSSGTYTVTLTVSDGRGRSDTDTVQISAANSAPVPAIQAPPAGSTYRAGTPLTVTGSATDTQDGSLPASAFSWNVVLIHKDHQHLVTNPQGTKSFSFTPVRDHGADSHYELRLSVTDSGGATTTTTRVINPETIPLHLRSTPSGAPLSWAGSASTAPWDGDAAIGFIGTVAAPETFSSDGVEREFVRWSSGAARVHNLTVPETETTLTAVYNARPAAVANVSPPTAPVAEPVQFGSTGSGDPDGEALTYQWSFGDGSTAAGATASHAFAAPGEYDVTLTVTDGAGATASDTKRVSITGPGNETPGGNEPPGGGDPSAGDGQSPSATPDDDGPLLRLWRPKRRPVLLAGLARDPAGIRSVQVAVARLARGGRCRWVRSVGLLARAAPCSPRRWLPAQVSGRRWILGLPHGLPAGTYRVWLLAHDRNGNAARRLITGEGSVRFAVAGARTTASCGAALLRRPLRCGALAG